MTDAKITRLLSRRNKLLTRRDGLYDHAVVDRIDAQLSAVEPGRNNEVDKALGRSNAVLTPRPMYLRNEQRTAPAEWFVSQAVTLEEMQRISANAMRDEEPIEY